MARTFYITTPIYYVNAEPHLGHAYSTIVCDVAARFHRMLGYEVRFQTGTDEHGDKIAQAAAKEGIEPQAFVDRISRHFKEAWPPLEIAHDNFIRTTDPGHVKVVQEILQKVHDQGDIYKAKYGGNYCVGCERFLTDKELVEGKCPDHGTEPVYIEEENYFFRMGKYQQALIGHIQENPEFIRPERYKNEVLSFLKEPLEDLCISRPKSRLTWGITLPFDPDFVTYVWFDALINYLTGLGWPGGEMVDKFWTGDGASPQHLIAKDILKPHGIYWPTMLMSLALAEGRAQDYYLYRHLNVHGYWNLGQRKMSKSTGDVVQPLDLAQIYGVDAFRYFVMREMTFGLDAAFSEELLVERYNADLANDLGNLFSRVLNMLHRYRDGVVPKLHQEQLSDLDKDMLAAFAALDGDKAELQFREHMHNYRFHVGLMAVWDPVRAANKYIVSTEPWEMAKDPQKAAALDNVLHILVQLLASVSHLIWPVMPITAGKMAAVLGAEIKVPVDWQALFQLKLLGPGGQTQKPQALFPRIDTAKVKAKAKKAEAKAAQAPPPRPKAKEEPMPTDEGKIGIEDFAKVQLKLGTVISAENIEGADKLLKLMVDLGEGSPRQIVAGLAQHYQPADLPGRQVVVVANLKPAKLRGVESNGMLLAAVDGDAVRILAPDQELKPGSQVR
ncbi:MAG: methionine--tRNA ligase [Desulfarculaceae bacterium]|jgi:methionyl-tRNA synthetase